MTHGYVPTEDIEIVENKEVSPDHWFWKIGCQECGYSLTVCGTIDIEEVDSRKYDMMRGVTRRMIQDECNCQ